MCWTGYLIECSILFSAKIVMIMVIFEVKRMEISSENSENRSCVLNLPILMFRIITKLFGVPKNTHTQNHIILVSEVKSPFLPPFLNLFFPSFFLVHQKMTRQTILRPQFTKRKRACPRPRGPLASRSCFQVKPLTTASQLELCNDIDEFQRKYSSRKKSAPPGLHFLSPASSKSDLTGLTESDDDRSHISSYASSPTFVAFIEHLTPVERDAPPTPADICEVHLAEHRLDPEGTFDQFPQKEEIEVMPVTSNNQATVVTAHSSSVVHKPVTQELRDQQVYSDNSPGASFQQHNPYPTAPSVLQNIAPIHFAALVHLWNVMCSPTPFPAFLPFGDTNFFSPRSQNGHHNGWISVDFTVKQYAVNEWVNFGAPSVDVLLCLNGCIAHAWECQGLDGAYGAFPLVTQWKSRFNSNRFPTGTLDISILVPSFEDAHSLARAASNCYLMDRYGVWVDPTANMFQHLSDTYRRLTPAQSDRHNQTCGLPTGSLMFTVSPFPIFPIFTWR